MVWHNRAEMLPGRKRLSVNDLEDLNFNQFDIRPAHNLRGGFNTSKRGVGQP